MVRIGLVTTEAPAHGVHGGIGTFVNDLARGLAKRSNAVTVLARCMTPEPQTLELEGVTYRPIRVRGDRLLSHVGCVMPALNFAWALARHIHHIEAHEGPFDLIEVPDYLGAGLFLPAVTKTPLVVRLHGYSRLIRRLNQRAPARGQAALEAMERQTYHQADVILAQSQALLDAARHDFNTSRASSQVVLPGIDADVFRTGNRGAVRAWLRIPEDAAVLLFVGRLEHRKGVNELVEAWLRLIGAGHSVHLVLAGAATRDFGCIKRFETLARQAGCAHLLHLTGFIPHERIHDWYAASDVFVAPSRFEPLGLVYLEAMAASRAIVACASGGVPEILSHLNDSYLIPRVHPKPLFEALHTLLLYPQLGASLGHAARRKVCEHLSLSAMTERTWLAYEQAFNNPPALKRTINRPLNQ
jgi:D-inositol-3-phosphate glycosyltransferase